MQLTNPEVWQDTAANALDYALHFAKEGVLEDAILWADQALRVMLYAKADRVKP